MASNKLSDAAVQRKKEPGMYGDGQGLWLQVTKGENENITKSWLFRYKRQGVFGGKARKMGLGPYPAVSLAGARERAREAFRLVLDSIDPIEARKAKKVAAQLEAARSKTFSDCA